MSVAHYFKNEPQGGFAQPDMAAFARRQLQMSLGLAMILALAALFIALAGGAEGPSKRTTAAPDHTMARTATAQARII